jgi:hypothetical protein
MISRTNHVALIALPYLLMLRATSKISRPIIQPRIPQSYKRISTVSESLVIADIPCKQAHF